MKIRWFADAVSDLLEIRRYIAKDKPHTAHDVARHIKESVELLKDHPAIGRPGRIHGTRELIISGMPYVIPYRVVDNTIEILRVFHGSRKWSEKL